jgi:hypothetical protein
VQKPYSTTGSLADQITYPEKILKKSRTATDETKLMELMRLVQARDADAAAAAAVALSRSPQCVSTTSTAADSSTAAAALFCMGLPRSIV